MDRISQKVKPCCEAGLRGWPGGWDSSCVCVQARKRNEISKGKEVGVPAWPEEGPENQTGALLLLETGIPFSFWNRQVP